MPKLKNSNCDKTQRATKIKNLTQIVTKLKKIKAMAWKTMWTIFGDI